MRGNRAAACALLLAGGAWNSARADVDDAVADFKAGHYLEAASELQAVLDRSPGYAYGHFLLGHCSLKIHRVADAQREFRSAVTIDPTRADYFEGFARSLSASGNWPFTIRAASEGLRLAPEPRLRFSLLALRGYAWASLRRWNEAVADLEAARQIRSEPWLLVFLGRARFAGGDYEGAVPALRQILLTVPDDVSTLRLLAESFLQLGMRETDPVRKRFDYVQSHIYAQRVAQLAPGDLEAVNLVGRAALGAGLLDQAENIFRHVLAVDPRHCTAMANLGRTYMATSRWTEAEVYLKKAAVCAPEMTVVYESLGQVYLELGKPQDAAEAFRRAGSEGTSRGITQGANMIPVFAPR